MNNRYLFRGKRVDNGEWVYGDYIFHEPNMHRIHIIEYTYNGDISMWRDLEFDVIPETVSQWTGLTDKNGKGVKVFEGDIIKFNGYKIEKDTPSVGYVYWNKYRLNFGVTTNPAEWNCDLSRAYEIEIIGNIHDAKNP